MAKFVEMQVDSIRVHMPSGQHVVILKEKETERYLPIWIGIYEANAIALKITGITPERPITPDLLANILQSAEMRLKKIQATSLTNEGSSARLFLAANGKEAEVASRPTDAIALAVRPTCPILASQSVLARRMETDAQAVADQGQGQPLVCAVECRRRRADQLGRHPHASRCWIGRAVRVQDQAPRAVGWINDRRAIRGRSPGLRIELLRRRRGRRERRHSAFLPLRVTVG